MPTTRVKIIMKNSSPFKILQITDTHLLSAGKDLFGVDCNKNFLSVINKVIENEKNIDFILATGDLSQDESSDSYQFFMETMEKLKIPVYWLPGNHDSTEVMEKVFSQSSYFEKLDKLSMGLWDFIFVDTKMPGKDTGWISNETLLHLEAQLKESEKNRKLVTLVMHHHPLLVNTPLIDQFTIENREKLLEVISSFSHVRLALCGHVHGDYKITSSFFILEACPATCFQFKKGASKLTLDHHIGYKILQYDGINYQAQGILW